MAYVGNSPEKGNFRKADQITCSATATYNLLVGGVAVNPNQNQCIVSLNGVIQSSGTSYTIASSQITFASALTSSDVIDFILILGDTLDVGTVSDNTIGLAQLSATGTPSSSNFLRGDNSWQTVSAGTSLSGSTDNQVTTVTGANAIQGETNFIYNGTIAGLGATGASADLGVGLHIKVSDTGASVNSGSDALVLEDNGGDMGMTLLSSTSGQGRIFFGDSGGNDRGQLDYDHGTDSMRMYTAGSEAFRIKQGNDNHFYKFDSTQSTEASYVMYIMSDKAEGNSSNRMIGFDNSSQGRGYIVAGDGDSDSPSFAAGSDRRLKENITNYTGGYDKIKSIPVKQWDEKYSSKKKGKIGWIADELDDVFPNAVSGTPNATKDVINSVLDKDGRLVLENTTKEEFDEKQSKGKYPNCTFHETATVPEYQYSSPLRFYADVVQALQSAITKIETLETENTDIKARLTALENK